jgi:hypothetical protein
MKTPSIDSIGGVFYLSGSSEFQSLPVALYLLKSAVITGGSRDMADEDGGGGASNFVWAIALIIIVAIVAAVVMSGGFLSRGDKKIDVDIKTPAR